MAVRIRVCLLLVAIFAVSSIADGQELRDPPRNHQPTVAESTDDVLVSARRIVDLTHTFDSETVYWPTEAGFQLIRGPAGRTDKGYYYSANRFAAAEHGGTHVDAPIHFFRDRNTVDQIPLEKLMGEAVVIDVTEVCKDNADYQIGVADLRGWETEHQRQLVDVIVLLRTGHSEYWNDRARYLGTDKTGPGAVAHLHFPGLAPEAARWLAEHRSIKSIGIDTPSIDYGQSQRFQSHVVLCGRNIPIFENVAHLKQVPASGAVVVALPMKIGEGTGAPLRIVALVK